MSTIAHPKRANQGDVVQTNQDFRGMEHTHMFQLAPSEGDKSTCTRPTQHSENVAHRQIIYSIQAEHQQSSFLRYSVGLLYSGSTAKRMAGLSLRLTVGQSTTVTFTFLPAPPLRTNPDRGEIDLPGAGTYELSLGPYQHDRQSGGRGADDSTHEDFRIYEDSTTIGSPHDNISEDNHLTTIPKVPGSLIEGQESCRHARTRSLPQPPQSSVVTPGMCPALSTTTDSAKQEGIAVNVAYDDVQQGRKRRHDQVQGENDQGEIERLGKRRRGEGRRNGSFAQ